MGFWDKVMMYICINLLFAFTFFPFVLVTVSVLALVLFTPEERARFKKLIGGENP